MKGWGCSPRGLRAHQFGCFASFCSSHVSREPLCLDNKMRFATRQRLRKLNGYIAQWLERLTADQQVPGSNPGVPSLGARFLFGFPALLVRLAYAAASACLNTNKPTSNMCWFLALASCLRFVCSSFASLVFPLAVLFRRYGRIGNTSKPKLLHSRAGRSASRLASENVCHFLRLRDFHRNLADNARSGLKPVSLKRKRSAQTCQLWGSNPRAVACSGS